MWLYGKPPTEGPFSGKRLGANEVNPSQIYYKGTTQSCKEAKGSVMKSLVVIISISTWQCSQVIQFTSRPPKRKVQLQPPSHCSCSSGQITVRCSRKATWADSKRQQGYFGKTEDVLMCSVRQKVKIQSDRSTSIILPQTVT